ncbi:hypothetical protein JTB14_031002 [Gonioctena quinquepunctata]|nr:hypothetical protein JTB14_031002 [Gonioctena quinquepunctata]
MILKYFAVSSVVLPYNMEWKGVMRKKVDLRLEEIIEYSKSRQTTSNESITEQNSSTGKIPVKKTGDEISEEAEEVTVNADFEDEQQNICYSQVSPI